MGSIASKHPFPFVRRENDGILPLLMAPSLYLIVSYAWLWGSGSDWLLSPTLTLATGILAVIGCARIIFSKKSSEPQDNQICTFCAVVMLIYLQLLLPRLWGWAAL